jgi:hypothetical protein
MYHINKLIRKKINSQLGKDVEELIFDYILPNPLIKFKNLIMMVQNFGKAVWLTHQHRFSHLDICAEFPLRDYRGSLRDVIWRREQWVTSYRKALRWTKEEARLDLYFSTRWDRNKHDRFWRIAKMDDHYSNNYLSIVKAKRYLRKQPLTCHILNKQQNSLRLCVKFQGLLQK